MASEAKLHVRLPNNWSPEVLCSYDMSDSDAALEAVGRQCDCACGVPSLQASSSFRQVSLGVTLRMHPGIRRIPLSEDHKVVFVPSTSALVVVNSMADALIDLFAQPRSVDFARSIGCDHEISKLAEAGILIDAIPELSSHQGEELAVWLHVTNKCNLRCSYCYVDKTGETMSPEFGFTAIDVVCRSATLHGFRRVKLKFAGGEPTLVMPLVLRLHDYARTRTEEEGLELQAVVLSNGVRLTRTTIEGILSRKMHLMISLDGLGSSHDGQRPLPDGRPSSEAVIEGIERAIAMGLTPEISVTITEHNAAHLRPLLKWILERDIPFNLNFCRDSGCSIASQTELTLREETLISGMLEAYATVVERFPARSLLSCLLDHASLAVPHQRTCGACHNYLVVGHHGQIAKCQMDTDRDVTSIWDPDPFLTIGQDKSGLQNPAVDEREGCSECEWRYWCGGGCPLETYRIKGRYDLRSPKCRIYQRLFPEVVRLEGLRILSSQEGYDHHSPFPCGGF